MRTLRTILVTGGSGFIGSNFIRYLFRSAGYDGRVVNVDKLTYAAAGDNLRDIEERYGGRRYFFQQADVADLEAMREAICDREADTIVHFAAESHVDRSIVGPAEFVRTNILGTFCLLEAARDAWKDREGVRFHHVSTDEVFGSLGPEGRFDELSRYDPHSPYSASKAASDLLARAEHVTYGLPLTVTHCSNNYGPFQFPEKLIPLAITSLLDGGTVPVYGDGGNRRDWLYVDDHSEAIWAVLRRGADGRTYAVGGDNERDNLEVVRLLCERVAELCGRDREALLGSIRFVKDRPGHDRRYAVDAGRIRRELGWRPRTGFSAGLDETIRWYLANETWVQRVRRGEYGSWLRRHYGAAAPIPGGLR